MRAPKRELLLETAEAIFSKEGFKGISVDRLLEETGVAKMTLYKGFDSKNALIAETLRRRGERLAAHLERYVEGAGPDAADRLLSCFDAMEDWSGRPEFNGCYFVNALTEYNTEDEEIGAVARAYKQRFLDFLRAICEQLKTDDPETTARSVFMLIEGATVTHMSLGDHESYGRAKVLATYLIA